MGRLVDGSIVKLVGVSFVPPAHIRQVAEVLRDAEYVKAQGMRPKTWLQPRAAALVQCVLDNDGLPVRLKHNPDNLHSDCVVEVWAPAFRTMIGHLPEKTFGNPARKVTEALAEGQRWEGRLVKALIHDRNPDNPGLQVRLIRRDS